MSMMMQGFLPEFDREMGTTRRLLERVPMADADWTPHVKSRTLGQIAKHIAEIPAHATRILTLSEFDATAPRPERPPVTSVDELLKLFDDNVAEARTHMVGKTDGELMAPWTFKQGGRKIFTMPKAGVLRMLCLSHIIHHRGQLSVYLRLRDVPLPSIYGPSADAAF